MPSFPKNVCKCGNETESSADKVCKQCKKIKKLNKRIKELEAALSPFAEAGRDVTVLGNPKAMFLWCPQGNKREFRGITVQDVLDAAALLKGTKNEN